MKKTNTVKEEKSLEIPAFDVEIVENKPEAKKSSKKPATKKEPAAKKEAKPAKKSKAKSKPLVFDSVTPAAQYLSDLLNLKITNAKDCIYRALRGKRATHNFNVYLNEDKKVVLEPIV